MGTEERPRNVVIFVHNIMEYANVLRWIKGIKWGSSLSHGEAQGSMILLGGGGY